MIDLIRIKVFDKRGVSLLQGAYSWENRLIMYSSNITGQI